GGHVDAQAVAGVGRVGVRRRVAIVPGRVVEVELIELAGLLDEGQDQRLRAGVIRPDGAADVDGAPRRRQVAVGALVVVGGQPHLLEVVLALHAGSRLAHLLHGRQQQADQDGDDGDDDQQLDEREARAGTGTGHGAYLRNERGSMMPRQAVADGTVTMVKASERSRAGLGESGRRPSYPDTRGMQAFLTPPARSTYAR